MRERGGLRRTGTSFVRRAPGSAAESCLRGRVRSREGFATTGDGPRDAFSQLKPSYDKGKKWNVSSAGWQVTLCDPMWRVSSRSGVATLRTAVHLLLTYLLTLVTLAPQPFSRYSYRRGTARRVLPVETKL